MLTSRTRIALIMGTALSLSACQMSSIASSLKGHKADDGAAVETAASGREGVDKFDAFGPDVVVVDIGLPEMNGFEVAHTIRSRERGKDARLIALTGYSPSEDPRWSDHAGFDFHLTKPVAYDELRPLLVKS